MPCEIHIVTNHNKVWRIAVFYQPQSEVDVKIEYNSLISSFLAKDIYLCVDTGYIDDNIDLSYEIGVHDKRIQASFCQLPEGFNKEIFFDKQEFLKNLHDKGIDSLYNKLNIIPDDKYKEVMSYLVPLLFSKVPSQVWFMISETHQFYTPYQILLFYDNRRNNREGDDL